jgi:hypothetical protein
MLWGQQKPAERDEVKRVFAPGSPDTSRAWLVAHPAAGGAALNFAGANLMLHMSHVPPGKSVIALTQAEGRVCRPGQTERVRTYNMVALGPEGQLTYDHAMLASRARAEGNVAWTKEQWLHALVA